MDKQEVFSALNQNPAFHLATVEGDQPHVRGMLLFKADEDGIVFHTANSKELFQQISANPKVELCFNAPNKQYRISGVLTVDTDPALRQEIINHPSRAFLHAWEKMGILDRLVIFRLKHGTCVTWTMETNFAPKQPLEL